MKKNLTNKVLSLALVLALISILIYQPSYAQAAGNGNYTIIDQKKVNGEVVYEVLKVDNSYYYYEKTEKVTTCYSIIQGNVDYAVNDGINVYAGKFKNNDNKNDFRSINKSIQGSYKNETKKSLASYFSTSDSSSLSNLSDTNISSIASSSTDTNFIMSWLYTYGGYPQAYYFRYTASMTRNSQTISIYDTVAYSINETNMWPIYIGTAISVVAAVLSLNPVTLLGIASFTYSIYGGYVIMRDINFTRYDVAVLQSKDCLHGQSLPYNTMYNVCYVAYCGDLNASLSQSYINGNSDYFDNASIFRTAFRNIGIIY